MGSNFWARLLGRKEAAKEKPYSGPAEGWVSIWVGDFTDELDLDGYGDAELERDHGLRSIADLDGEYAVRDAPTPIADLLKSFWLANRWASRAASVCSAEGAEVASCARVYVHYRHVPSFEGRGPLRFAACVPVDAPSQK